MQVSEHVHALRLPFTIPAAPGVELERFVYAFPIYGENICLVDTGVASSAGSIIDYILKAGRPPEDIGMVVQTHCHPDHIGATKQIREVSGCAVAAHGLERRWIEDVSSQAKARPVPGFDRLVGGPVPVDRVLADGDVIDLGGGLTLEVIHTPGHSRGSVSLYMPNDGVLFSGDAVPVPGEFPIYDDFPAAVASLKILMGIDGTKVLLSSWDVPRKGADIMRALEDGLGYLRRIHEAVIQESNEGSAEPLALCARVVKLLGLPPAAVNPLVARSFMSNLEVVRKGIEPGF